MDLTVALLYSCKPLSLETVEVSGNFFVVVVTVVITDPCRRTEAELVGAVSLCDVVVVRVRCTHGHVDCLFHTDLGVSDVNESELYVRDDSTGLNSAALTEVFGLTAECETNLSELRNLDSPLVEVDVEHRLKCSLNVLFADDHLVEFRRTSLSGSVSRVEEMYLTGVSTLVVSVVPLVHDDLCFESFDHEELVESCENDSSLRSHGSTIEIEERICLIFRVGATNEKSCVTTSDCGLVPPVGGLPLAHHILVEHFYGNESVVNSCDVEKVLSASVLNVAIEHLSHSTVSDETVRIEGSAFCVGTCYDTLVSCPVDSVNSPSNICDVLELRFAVNSGFAVNSLIKVIEHNSHLSSGKLASRIECTAANAAHEVILNNVRNAVCSPIGPLVLVCECVNRRCAYRCNEHHRCHNNCNKRKKNAFLHCFLLHKENLVIFHYLLVTTHILAHEVKKINTYFHFLFFFSENTCLFFVHICEFLCCFSTIFYCSSARFVVIMRICGKMHK